MRVILLTAAAVCFAIASVLASHLGLFGVDHDMQLAPVWGWAGAIWFAMSFLPWGTRLRYWFEQ